jgi:hypothetical protein
LGGIDDEGRPDERVEGKGIDVVGVPDEVRGRIDVGAGVDALGYASSCIALFEEQIRSGWTSQSPVAEHAGIDGPRHVEDLHR